MSAELEFISVDDTDPEDDMDEGGYNPADEDSTYDRVIGNSCLNQSKHPYALVFHFLFKSLALFIYIFGGWFTSNFIVHFVTCIILLAFDFWTVKNITGRLLVGLRWWSYVQENGNSEWVFESLEDMAEVSAFDSKVFWGALYLTPVIWAVFLFLGVLRLKLEYMPIVIAALMLSGANLMGYVKCSNSAQEKVQSMISRGFKDSSMAALQNSSFRNWVLSLLVAAPAPSATPVRTAEV